MSECAGLSWYAVQTRSNFEKRVTVDLSLKGIEAYLPAVLEVRQWKDRKKEIEAPVFPGYLFVKCTTSARERLMILNTTGVARILSSGGVPEPVPDKDVEDIRTLVNSGTPFVRHAFLKEGVRVMVKRGPLRGVCGILETFKKKHRLVLSVELLSQSIAAEVDVEDVEETSSETFPRIRGRAPSRNWAPSLPPPTALI